VKGPLSVRILCDRTWPLSHLEWPVMGGVTYKSGGRAQKSESSELLFDPEAMLKARL
jgi:hypothetical protein